MRENYPTLDALIKLSEKSAARCVSEGESSTSAATGSSSKANLGYVVIDARFIPPDRARMVIEAFKLIEIQRRTRTPDAVRSYRQRTLPFTPEPPQR